MADKFLTLLDMTKVQGTDLAVGVVEEVRTFAPEAEVLMGRPISGTSYKSLIRTALPAGPAFRKTNQGSDILSSAYDQKVQECFYLDGQMAIDEAVLSACELGEDYMLSMEAVGALKQKLITLGNQIYYGAPSDTDAGFPGLQYLYDSTNMQQKAGGTTASVNTSAYFVLNTLDGVSLIYGKNAGIQMNAWMRQQKTDNNSKSYFAKVNNLAGWIGLSFNYSRSVARVCNIDNVSATTFLLTDAIGAKALAKYPVGVVPQFCFMNRPTRLGLQISRSAIIGAITANEPLRFAPTPAEIGGIKIVVTDSLINTEALVA